jgi:hypothetical protein
MATTIDTSQNPLAAYGYDSATGQQLAQSLGLTTQQLAAAFATTPTTGGSAPQTTSYGMTTGGSPGGRDLDSTIQQLQLIKAAGGGGQNQQSGPPSSTPGQVSSDPMNAAINLGAAALQMPAVYNPTPGQIPAGSKGGVSTVMSPTSSGTVPTVPQGPWTNQASPVTSPGQAAAAQLSAQYSPTGQPNSNPANNATFFQGMTGQNPAAYQGVAPTAGGTPTPVMPANAPGAQRPATPFATAPPAPGIDPAVHNTALQNAGKALYSHFGGDPSSATHADIANFHSQLIAGMGAVTGGQAPFGAAPAGAQNYTAGLPPGAATATPVKMASGGYVPGDPNDPSDSVPAYLSPGEYVMSKQEQIKRLSEAQHRALTTDQSAPPAQSQSTPDQASQTPAPAAPGGYTGPTAAQLMAQKNAALNSQGASGGGYNIPSDLGGGYIGGSPAAGQSGYYYPSQSAATAAGDVGTGPGGGGPSTAGSAAGVASGLASGLASAAKAYADSIGSWKTQQSHIPGPDEFKQQQQQQFGQMIA